MTHRSKQQAEGFTLLESLLASVVLVMAVAAITMPFVVAARNGQVDSRLTVAIGLAEEMMEEILAKNFLDENTSWARNLGPDPGETVRSRFDNIDDYHQYSESTGTVADIQGQVINDPATHELSRNVTVTYVYVSGQDTSEPPTFARVEVDLLYQGQTIVQLTRLASVLTEG